MRNCSFSDVISQQSNGTSSPSSPQPPSSLNSSKKSSENGSNHQRQRSGKLLLENLNITSSNGSERPKPQILELVINKDKYGYGMKVSGENPVFVDSVKEGGAAFRAGLHAADMILRVNGHNRNARNFALPLGGSNSPVIIGATTPNTPTPTSQRNSITAPLPVDHNKRMEVEFTKMHTLFMMLEQEKKNLEKLRENESQNGNELCVLKQIFEHFKSN
ncbi:hypothetical protein PVAND_017712 [Polypedilum vanderplanki]|uniref:PDZ domain-containing protein n=1 Tax=Polypedilum vanderplanki TaxID=319348 RepID=A0A9J6B8G0_POLVA|nr:hypothetical protein PVAND_017712 [Polypedilum vanderplanki]